MQTKYILPTTNYNRQIYLKGKGCNLHFAKPNCYIQIYLKVRAPSYILCNPLQYIWNKRIQDVSNCKNAGKKKTIISMTPFLNKMQLQSQSAHFWC